MIIQLLKNNQFLSYWFYRLKDLYNKPFNKLEAAYLDDYWKDRIQIVCASSDNKKIYKTQNAGKLFESYQIMHNGLKVFIGSYYGTGTAMFGMHEMLRLNKGIHEPQEEYIFQEILKILPQNATMLELGSYWAFYSMWFKKEIPNGKNFMIEPDSRCLYSGKRNFEINNLNGNFFQYLIGAYSKKTSLFIQISVDDFLEQQNITHLDVLHCDIQGYELEMLQGAKKTLSNKRATYIFISTHSDKLHQSCREKLIEYGYYIISDADLAETFSFDGLLVASINMHLFEISKRK